MLIIVSGEFGRSPQIEYTGSTPGRNHYPQAMSILVSGGGMKMGQVVGKTNPLGEYPEDRPLSPANFLETVYRHLRIDTSREFLSRTERPMRILDPAEPITELL